MDSVHRDVGDFSIGVTKLHADNCGIVEDAERSAQQLQCTSKMNCTSWLARMSTSLTLLVFLILLVRN